MALPFQGSSSVQTDRLPHGKTHSFAGSQSSPKTLVLAAPAHTLNWTDTEMSMASAQEKAPTGEGGRSWFRKE